MPDYFTPGSLLTEEVILGDDYAEWTPGLASQVQVLPIYGAPHNLTGAHTTALATGDVIAVDDNPGSHDVLKIANADGAITTFVASGSIVGNSTLCIRGDSSGRLVIATGNSGPTAVDRVYRYDAAGTLVDTTVGSPGGRLLSFAIHPDGNAVYAVTGDTTTLTLWKQTLGSAGWSALATKAAPWSTISGPNAQPSGLGLHSDGSILWQYCVTTIDGNEDDGFTAQFEHFLDKLDSDGDVVSTWALTELDWFNGFVTGPIVSGSGNGFWPLLNGDADGVFWGWETKGDAGDPDDFLKVIRIDITDGPVARYDYYDHLLFGFPYWMPIWPYGTSGCQPVIFTDNGFAYRRSGQDIYSVVSHGSGIPSASPHAYEEEIVYGVYSAPNAGAHLAGWGNTGDTRTPIWSSDAGATWTSPTYHTLTVPSGFATLDPIGQDGLSSPIDNDGRQYARGFRFSDSHWVLFRTNSYHPTAWTQLVDLTAAGIDGSEVSGVCIADTYLWWVSGGGSPDGPAKLNRLDLAGTNWQQFDTPDINAGLAGSGLQGYSDTHRLICWQIFGGGGGGNKILSIDITDPDAPTFSLSAVDPFGASAFNLGVHLFPLTSSIAVALTWDDNDPDADAKGGIWRSTDAGITWTAIEGPSDPHLGNALLAANVGFDNEVSAVAVDGSDIWVVGGCPYLFHSTDLGLTWTEETVDLSLVDGYLDGVDDQRPVEWTAIAIGCSGEGGGGPGGVGPSVTGEQSWQSWVG